MTGEARILALIDAVRYWSRATCPELRRVRCLAGGVAADDDRDAPGDRRRRPRHPRVRHVRGHDRANREGHVGARAARARDLVCGPGGRRARLAYLFAPTSSTRGPCARRCWRPATRPSGFTSTAGRSRRRFPPSRRALALLRLDTDWYESTRHELDHLYPRLAGRRADRGRLRALGGRTPCRRRVHGRAGVALLLNRIDYTGRVAVSPEQAPQAWPRRVVLELDVGPGRRAAVFEVELAPRGHRGGARACWRPAPRSGGCPGARASATCSAPNSLADSHCTPSSCSSSAGATASAAPREPRSARPGRASRADRRSPSSTRAAGACSRRARPRGSSATRPR